MKLITKILGLGVFTVGTAGLAQLTEKRYPTEKQVTTAISILNESLQAEDTKVFQQKIDKALTFIQPKVVDVKLKGQLFCGGKDVLLSPGGDCAESICYKGDPNDVIKILNARELDLLGDEYWYKSPKVRGDKIHVILWDGPNEVGDEQVIGLCK